MPLATRLHTYPKIFNRKGHLKVLPFRKPLSIHTTFVYLCSVAIYLSVFNYQQWIFLHFSQLQFFKKDQTQLLLRKRSFDNLILGNKIMTCEDQVKKRSLF